MSVDLFFENILTDKFKQHIFFYSEINTNGKEDVVNNNIFNKFSLPLVDKNGSPMEFKPNSVMHLASMDVPSNMVSLSVQNPTITNSIKSFNTKMIYSHNPYINKVNVNLSNPIEFYLVTESVVLDSNYQSFTNNLWLENGTEYFDILNDITIDPRKLTSTVNGLSFFNDESLYGNFGFLRKTIYILNKFTQTLLTYGDVLSTFNSTELSQPDIKPFYKFSLEKIFNQNFQLQYCFVYKKSNYTNFGAIDNGDEIFSLAFKFDNKFNNELQLFKKNNIANWTWQYKSTEKINSYLLNNQCIFPNVETITNKNEFTEATINHFGFFPDMSLFTTSFKHVVQDFSPLINYLFNDNLSIYDNLHLWGRTTYEKFINGVWVTNSINEILNTPFIIFVEHAQNPSNADVLKIINPDYLPALKSTKKFPIFVIKISPAKKSITGIVETVKIKLYIQIYFNTNEDWILNIKRQIFLPWEIIHFFKKLMFNEQTDTVIGTINKTTTSVDKTYYLDSSIIQNPRNIQLYMCSVYESTISKNNSIAEQFLIDSSWVNNDVNFLHPYLSQILFNYIKTKFNLTDTTTKAFLNNTKFLKPKNQLEQLPYFRPQDFLFGLHQLTLPLPQTDIPTNWNGYFLEYGLNFIDIKKLPLPWFRQKQVIFPNVQLQFPNIIQNTDILNSVFLNNNFYKNIFIQNNNSEIYSAPNEEFTLLPDNIITNPSFPALNEFCITFEFKFLSINAFYSNIFQLQTITNQNICRLFLPDNSYKLYLISDDLDTFLPNMTLNQWYTFTYNKQYNWSDNKYHVIATLGPFNSAYKTVKTTSTSYTDVNFYFAKNSFYVNNFMTIKNFYLNTNRKTNIITYNIQENRLLSPKNIIFSGCNNNLIGTLITLDDEFLISFEFMVNDYHSTYINVLHFTTNLDSQRVPALWVNPNSFALYFVDNFWTPGSINIGNNQFVLFYMERKKIGSSYTLNYNIAGYTKSVTTTTITQYNNMKVYIGDPWHDNRGVFYRNLNIVGTMKNSLTLPSFTPIDIYKNNPLYQSMFRLPFSSNVNVSSNVMNKYQNLHDLAEAYFNNQNTYEITSFFNSNSTLVSIQNDAYNATILPKSYNGLVYDNYDYIFGYLYSDDIKTIYSNEKMISLYATAYIAKLSSTFQKMYYTWKNSSKQLLKQNRYKEITFETKGINGNNFFQLDVNENVITNNDNSKPLKNVLLYIYEPMGTFNGNYSVLFLYRNQNFLNNEINPFTLSVSTAIVNDFKNLNKGGKTRKRFYGIITEIQNINVQAINYSSNTDKYILIKFEQAQKCDVVLNNKYEEGIVCLINLSDYITNSDAIINVDLYKNYESGYNGKMRYFEFNDLEDLTNFRCSFYNSKMELLQYSLTDKNYFNPTFKIHFAII